MTSHDSLPERPAPDLPVPGTTDATSDSAEIQETAAQETAAQGTETQGTAELDGPVEVERADRLPQVRKLPQPNLLAALALTAVPVLAQMVLGIGIMLVALGLFIVITAKPHAAGRFMEDVQVWLVPVGTLITLLVAVVVCWLFFGRAMRRVVAWRRFSPGQLVSVVALTFPLAVVASEVTNCAGMFLQQFDIAWLRAYHETSGDLFLQFMAQPWWLVFVGGCLLPGLGEELYCRGLVSRGLVARYGVVAGTLFAAGLFGAMHLEPVQAIGAFALGVALQFVFLTTRSLAAPIVLHTLNNSCAFLTMRYADSLSLPGLTPTADGSIVHTPVFVLVAATASAASLIAILYQTRTRWRLPDGSDWSPGYVTAEMPDARLGAVPVQAPAHLVLILCGMLTWAIFVASLVAAHQLATAA